MYAGVISAADDAQPPSAAPSATIPRIRILVVPRPRSPKRNPKAKAIEATRKPSVWAQRSSQSGGQPYAGRICRPARTALRRHESEGRDRRSGPVALFPGGQQGDGVGEYVAELLELAEPGFFMPAPREADRHPDPAILDKLSVA